MVVRKKHNLFALYENYIFIRNPPNLVERGP